MQSEFASTPLSSAEGGNGNSGGTTTTAAKGVAPKRKPSTATLPPPAPHPMSVFLGSLLEQVGGIAHTVTLSVAAKAEFPGAKQRDGIDVGDGVAFERFVGAKLREAAVATRREDHRWVIAEDDADILKITDVYQPLYQVLLGGIAKLGGSATVDELLAYVDDEWNPKPQATNLRSLVRLVAATDPDIVDDPKRRGAVRVRPGAGGAKAPPARPRSVLLDDEADTPDAANVADPAALGGPAGADAAVGADGGVIGARRDRLTGRVIPQYAKLRQNQEEFLADVDTEGDGAGGATAAAAAATAESASSTVAGATGSSGAGGSAGGDGAASSATAAPHPPPTTSSSKKRSSSKYVCPVCNKSYKKNSDDTPWISCDDCPRWVMVSCDGIGDVSVYDDETPGHLRYTCPVCRKERGLPASAAAHAVLQRAQQEAEASSAATSTAATGQSGTAARAARRAAGVAASEATGDSSSGGNSRAGSKRSATSQGAAGGSGGSDAKRPATNASGAGGSGGNSSNGPNVPANGVTLWDLRRMERARLGRGDSRIHRLTKEQRIDLEAGAALSVHPVEEAENELWRALDASAGRAISVGSALGVDGLDKASADLHSTEVRFAEQVDASRTEVLALVAAEAAAARTELDAAVLEARRVAQARIDAAAQRAVQQHREAFQAAAANMQRAQAEILTRQTT
eukprot:CAMPEP_0170747880 /NCGR_PEP_ID=MMETSP0437-20130122/9557_1 /TAXON_ID=0 /ORGANISM="Sexangularia sp." /LENGTH=685 /DNA_ID=CAMNT_0011086685 /DNA_START=125 /DNA_END=2178 /DNA_ORIENTATION=-